MIAKLIAEATECDFKVALEKRKPKSWRRFFVQRQRRFL